MSHYFSTLVLTRALVTALLGSLFIYLAHWGVAIPLLDTLVGVAFFYLLLPARALVWFWTGVWVALLWFWWIAMSFIHYQMVWAIPLLLLFIAIVYGTLFWSIATLANKVESYLPATRYPLPALIVKSLGLLTMSYIHPFGFDWYKPELVFVQSYLGIEKWHFALLLLSLVVWHWRKSPYALLLLPLAYTPTPAIPHQSDPHLTLLSTHITIEEKWDTQRQPKQFGYLLQQIDNAIDANQTLIVLPESVFPLFLNRNPSLFEVLRQRATKINIVTGALYWDGKTPKNTTYIFTRDGRVHIANKVILVPFGEQNPLPDFLSDWVNHIFYGDAVDYKPDTKVSDYTIDGVTYRNAICFEATSEKLYEGNPKAMIVLSNNGWFVPSIEPTLQRLLLQYYSRKYGTTIYHAVNMSPSYTIAGGRMVP